MLLTLRVHVDVAPETLQGGRIAGLAPADEELAVSREALVITGDQ
jgi:hypothetical protein